MADAGAPIFLSAGESFAVATLTERELEEFRRQEGERCPTPMHAIRYGQLSKAIEERLKPSDMVVYKESIRLKKKQGASAREIEMADTAIDIIEARILGATARSKQKVHAWREKKGSSVSGLRRLVKGTPVRSRADAARRGVIDDGWTVQLSGDHEEQVCVRFEGQDSTTNLRRDEVVTLCSGGCGEDAPSMRCSRCGAAFYCSTACQGSHWQVHKKTCQEAKKEAAAGSQAAAGAETDRSNEAAGAAEHDGGDDLCAGSRVRVEGLISAAHLNARVGKVTGRAPGGRISVELEGDGKVISVKRDNLRRAAG
jgi:hypothetical protein